MEYTSLFVIAVLLARSDAQLRYFSNIEDFQSSLQPVQGLYVKPSGNGETGDLFVAASEDNGMQIPWVSDTSVKLMKNQQPKEQPGFSNEINKGNVVAAAPGMAAAQPQYVQVPQLFYSQLLAAAAMALAGEADESPEPLPTLPTGFLQAWGSYPYPQPQPQFVLLAPEAWAQAQAALAASAAPAATSSVAAAAASSAVTPVTPATSTAEAEASVTDKAVPPPSGIRLIKL